MLGEVKIFDGQGNLKEIVQPVFNYECAPVRKYLAHECFNKKCHIVTQRKFFCSSTCAELVKEARKKTRRADRQAEKADRPTRPCQICGEPTPRLKNCSTQCMEIANRARSMSATTKERFLNEAKQNKKEIK